jgi:hypothetical protein
MLRFYLFGILTLIVVFALVTIGYRVYAQSSSPTPPPPVSASSAAGSMDIQSPDALTSFTVSNPYCYQPDPAVDQCMINLRFVQANDNQSSAPYMTWLTIGIDGKNRFSATAFFEGLITYTYDMNSGGMKVPCGAPNAGGAGTAYGNVYHVTITPLDSSRIAMSTDIANVTCPAYAP